MHYDFDTCPNRRQSESLKWNEYEDDVLPLWVADMDFVSPAPVVQALIRRAQHGVFGYPTKSDDLCQAIIDRLERLYRWKVQPDDLIFLPGVIVGFNLACQALASPSANVLVQTPIYPPILKAPSNAGVQRQDAPLVQSLDGSYQVDLEAFEASIIPNTPLFILCNPHNPVGRVFRKDELESMAEICLRRNVKICSDEIHCDLIYPGYQHIPIASLAPEIAQNTITIMAPSKTYNIAGLDCSFAVIQNPELRQLFQDSYKGLVKGVNLMGMTAALAAYQDGQEWLDQVLLYLQANSDFLYETIQQELPQLRMVKPEGTYLAWIDCRQAGIPGNPHEFFLKNAHVALNDGKAFGSPGEGFVRLNYACPRSTLDQALIRIKISLEAILTPVT